MAAPDGAATTASADEVRVVGERVTLRPYRPDDVDAVVALADNPKIARWLRDGFPSPYTREAAVEWVTKIAPSMTKDGKPLVFVIEVDGAYGGSISLTFEHDIHRYCCELGYWLAEPLWGRGLMTEAVNLIVSYGFETFGEECRRIFAVPLSGNAASGKVLAKCGFQLEGVMRQHAVKAGVVYDSLLYAIVRDDWVAAKAKASDGGGSGSAGADRK